jgi:hypothetical protein
LGIIVFAMGCSGDDSSITVGSLDKVPETDAQSAPTEARLPQPLAVIAHGSDGTALARIKIQWQIDAGAGSLSDSVSWTDASGRAQIDYTVGRSVGQYNVRAQVAVSQNKSASFTANAVAPPVLGTVTPSTFTGGDVLTISGTALSAAAIVDIGGAPANVTGGTATSITVVAPICLAPGSVAIRARVNGGNSNTLNATYNASGTPVQLGVGQYASVDPSQLASCATFPAADIAGSGTEYLMAPQATGAPGVMADYLLAGNQAPIPAPPLAFGPPDEPPTPQRAFHDKLRQLEREMSMASRSAAPAATAAAPSGVAMVPPPKVGDTKQFKVLNNVNGNYQLQDFTTVQARAKFVGSHVAIFQDVTVPADGFTDAEFQTMGTLFNDVLYDNDNKAYGVESDVDENGIVYMLLTPVVNKLTPSSQCSSGVITGFFFSIDIDPGYSADARANQAEIFYTLVPDATGSLGCSVPKSRINQIVPSTFVHEFQHMISYGQHVLFRHGLSEDLWLNEAMSHLAEELGAIRMRDMGDNQAFSDFVIGDLFDAYSYLRNPIKTFTFYSAGSGTLAERGGSWLFLRWLVDKFGPNITRRMEETPLIGIDNVNAATGEPISRLMSQWFLANYVSDLPNFTAPARLKYDSWAFRTTYMSLNQQNPSRYPLPFPLVPKVFNAASFSATDTLRAGSGDFFRVQQTAGQPGFTVRLTNATGGAISTTAAPRLNIIRIK